MADEVELPSETCTILSARLSNPDGTAWIAETAELGPILVTLNPGKAAKFAALQDWIAAGGQVAPFVPQEIAPEDRDLRAMFQALKATLVRKNVVTAQEIAADDKGNRA